MRSDLACSVWRRAGIGQQPLRLIRARLAVYECLPAASWTPPTHIVLEQRADRRLLREHDGALAG